SGMLVLPVGSVNSFPILVPETTAVRLTMNQCIRDGGTRSIRMNNAGRGTLRYTATPIIATPGLTIQPEGTQAPPSLRFSMSPGVTRRPGTTTTQILLQSAEAINIPPVIRVYQNWQNADTKTNVFPIEVAFALVNDPEGLVDVLMDNARQRVYIANSGRNQIEVFDIRQQTLLDPIEVGQFPRSMAFDTDGRTLFVANSGGEWISMVDLDQGREY